MWEIDLLIEDCIVEFGFDDDLDKTILREYIEDLEYDYKAEN
jgi:hypothetical protein